MTYAPAMKFHNYYFKSYLKLISLILILTSCASLNTSNKSYNLEGKLSYISEEQSSIFRVKIASNIKKSSIDAKETNFISTKIYSVHIDKPLDLNFSEAAVSWLHNYKSIKQIESFKLFKIKNNISIPDNYFYIIYYCYVYVITN